MLIHPLIEIMRSLRLFGMVKAFEELNQLPDSDAFSFEERLTILLEREKSVREERQLANRLKKAKLRIQACFEDIDYRSSRCLDRALIRSLGMGDWIKQHKNIMIIGSTGTGKSYLACALAHKACLLGFKSMFFKQSRLLLYFGQTQGQFLSNP